MDRKIIYAVIAVALAVLAWVWYVGVVQAREIPQIPKKTICHVEKPDEGGVNQQTLTLPFPAALAHLIQHTADYEGECERPEPTTTPKPTITPEPTPGTVIVCLDGESEKEIPDTKQAWRRVIFSYPNAYLGECEKPEPTVTPKPTVTPELEKPSTVHTPKGVAKKAPTCPDDPPEKVAANFHVFRNGGDVIARWIPTGGDSVNLYYENLNDSGDRHALIDVPNDGEEEVHELGSKDWRFGLQQRNGCSAGPIVWVDDGLTQDWVLFGNPYLE